jgi:cholesterol transport system auxiliary component
MRHSVNSTSFPVRLGHIAGAATLALAVGFGMTGCASHKGELPTQFDFGPAPIQQQQTASAGALGPVVLTDVTGSSALDNERMMYRLSYADALQARAYANSRWTATPLQLLNSRLRTRLAQAGAQVLSETDATTGIPLLRVDVDEFVHDFTSPAESNGRLTVRASVFRGHALVAQRSFSRTTPAPSADAAGGARALAGSTDAIAADLAAWLATLPPAPLTPTAPTSPSAPVRQ